MEMDELGDVDVSRYRFRVSSNDIIQCSFSKWYHKFEKVTPLSFIVPLPIEFVNYLLSDDTLRLPGKPYRWKKESLLEGDDEDNDDDSDVSWSDVDDEDELGEGATDVPAFEKLSRCVAKKIRKLGGRCFPKLDWSCPKDASWIGLNNSLSCSTFVDICLLLKSSSFVIHDLTNPFEYCDRGIKWENLFGDDEEAEGHPTDTRAMTLPQLVRHCQLGSPATESTPFSAHHLILRKWVEIEPSFEFRCFVRNRRLIAISQREISQYYGYIVEQQDQIVGDIISFFKEYIKDRFPLENYTFDVYRSRKDYVRLIDFNIFCPQTDGLLFEWDELHDTLQVRGGRPEFRFHVDSFSIRPSNYRQYSLPVDVLHYASGSSAERLIDLMRIHDVQRPKAGGSGHNRGSNSSDGKQPTASSKTPVECDTPSSSSSESSSSSDDD